MLLFNVRKLQDYTLFVAVVWIFFYLASCVVEWSEESLGRKGGKRKQGKAEQLN
jgi:hypothetical protein